MTLSYKVIATGFLSALTGAGLVTGCQTGGAAGGSPAARYVVTADRSAFYEHGPAQDYGPDLSLTEGQEVEMVERGAGFSRVKISTGKVGYVASEDLAVAPPRDPEPQSYARDYTGGISHDPAYHVAEDVALDIPLPEEEPKPVTSFRY